MLTAGLFTIPVDFLFVCCRGWQRLNWTEAIVRAWLLSASTRMTQTQTQEMRACLVFFLGDSDLAPGIRFSDLTATLTCVALSRICINQEVFLSKQASEPAPLSFLCFTPPLLYPLTVYLASRLRNVSLTPALPPSRSPCHLCPELRQWSWLPVSMVTGWCSKRAGAPAEWRSECDFTATSSVC